MSDRAGLLLGHVDSRISLSTPRAVAEPAQTKNDKQSNNPENWHIVHWQHFMRVPYDFPGTLAGI
jgi:hypothetical protein